MGGATSGKGGTRETDKSIVSGMSRRVMFGVLRSENFEPWTLLCRAFPASLACLAPSF